jgi:hypothetical protein
VGGAGGEHQVVVGDAGAAAERDLARGNVDGDDFVHQDLGVGSVAQDGADGLGDVGRGKHGEGDLIEQRLKDVVVAAVDDGDVDGQLGQALAALMPAKPPPTMTTRRGGLGGQQLGLGADGRGRAGRSPGIERLVKRDRAAGHGVAVHVQQAEGDLAGGSLHGEALGGSRRRLQEARTPGVSRRR